MRAAKRAASLPPDATTPSTMRGSEHNVNNSTSSSKARQGKARQGKQGEQQQQQQQQQHGNGMCDNKHEQGAQAGKCKLRPLVHACLSVAV